MLLNWTTLELSFSFDQETPVSQWRENSQSWENIDKLIGQWTNVWVGPSSKRITKWLANKKNDDQSY